MYDRDPPLSSGQISMPTYEYVCKSCGATVEKVQSFSDKPLRRHETCGGDLQKVFHARGIVFKGPGFYTTDARASSNTSKNSEGSKAKETSKASKDGSGSSSKEPSKSSSKEPSKSSVDSPTPSSSSD
ncbi:MAG TPA: FmdB family zinc ribbon protein [Acidimicrobiia bacterium]